MPPAAPPGPQKIKETGEIVGNGFPQTGQVSPQPQQDIHQGDARGQNKAGDQEKAEDHHAPHHADITHQKAHQVVPDEAAGRNPGAVDQIIVLKQIEESARGDHEDEAPQKGEAHDLSRAGTDIAEGQKAQEHRQPIGTHPEDMDEKSGGVGAHKTKQIMEGLG